MPLPAYRRLHPGTRIEPNEITILENYLTRSDGKAPSAGPGQAQAARLIPVDRAAAGDVEHSPNGIAFPAGYRDWQQISSTLRFDNHTLRAILGNAVAVEAIAREQVEPWPDGTMFAKVAWDAVDGDAGALRCGAFKQVEFMIKDSKRYASTAGWGWARWLGSNLKPYGKRAEFTSECVGCHTPHKNEDYVFTMPVPNVAANAETGPPAMFNQAAQLSGDLPYQPLRWRVITEAVNQAASTMSTLLGNHRAVDTARSNLSDPYPAGSVLSLMTWESQPDDHWFGAKIPGRPRSVEFVSVDQAPGQRMSYTYRIFEGSPLREATQQAVAVSHARIAAILSEPDGPMPWR